MKDGLGWKGWTLIIVGVVALYVAVSFLAAWILWLLWNWLVPELFGGPRVTYWQAVGVMLLLSFVRGVVTINSRRSE